MLDWTDEHKMMRDALRQFVQKEVVPLRDQLEHGDLPPYGVLRKLFTSFGIDMSPDRSALAIGACMKYSDGTAHIELAEYRDTKRHGTAWAADWIAQRWSKTAAVVIDAQSPAMVLLPELKSRGVKVMVNTTNGMGRACGRVLDMLTAGTLKHLPDEAQPQLTTAVANATTRPIGKSGAFGWNKAGSDIDISPLVACTMALQGAWTTRRNPNRRQHVMH